MKLGELFTINIGTNISRLKILHSETQQMYSHADLLFDIGQAVNMSGTFSEYSREGERRYILEEGDILYHFITGKVVIVSRENSGKMFNQNFARLSANNRKIDPKYLCYLLNESPMVKRQLTTLMQGSVMRGVTPAILRQIDLEIIEKELQIKLGNIYWNLNRYNYLIEQESKIQNQMVLETIKYAIKKEGNEPWV